jgi:protein phosphatase
VSLSIGFKTDIGRKRENNEDSYAVLRREELDKALDSLCVVADGMGGGRHGDVASSLVAQTVPETILEFLYERDRRNGDIDTSRMLRDTLVRVNHRLWMRGLDRSELRGMGTTCVTAILKEDVLTIGNVGDSRAYLLREGKLRQITEDHSEVWQQVRAGNMTRDQARVSKHRNSITQAMGLKSEVTPDVEQIPLQEGDTVLLCTDGLTTEIADADIARILASAPEAQEACDRLVAAALRHGGSDNITVVVMRYGTFIPIALPDALPEEAEEELPTDPSAEWRRSETRAAMPREARHYAEDDADYEDADDAYEDRPSDRREFREDADTVRSPGSNLLVALLIILLLVAIGEAVALTITVKHRTITRAPIVQLPPEAAPPRVTDGPLTYFEPDKVINQPVLSSFLAIDPGDNVYAVSARNGRVMRIDKQGKTDVIIPPRQHVRSEDLADQPHSSFEEIYMAFDPSGNRYQSNPAFKCIDKYQGSTRILQIDRGQLKNPASLVVNSNGTVYVVDDGYLYRIDATPPLDQQPGQPQPGQQPTQ